MRFKDEDGQAIIIVALAMSIFLIGAVGLAVDGAHIYAQRQMAQTAADAGAEAGIMSIFDGTNSTSGNPAAFSTAGSFTCGTGDSKTPCAYAFKNGFGGSTTDTVTVDFPAATAAPGVNFSKSDPVSLMRVTVQRNVSTTLMGLLGTSASTIKATSMAAIVNVVAPVPILVTHPTMAGSFSTNGGVLVKICGGPSRSFQINSGSTVSVSTKGSGTIDLSKAGPPDPGNCTTGTGADFGNWGGPMPSPPFILQSGSTGSYRQTSPIQDPLAGVAAPPIPSNAPAPSPLANGSSGCPASPRKACMLYSPGAYPTGIDGKLSTVIFKPGIYYIQNGGMTCSALCDMYMATGQPADGSSGTNTGWTGNMMVYNTGTGAINLGANGNVNLVGAPIDSKYLGILFFEDRNAAANTGKNAHSLGGGGSLQLSGTIYLTNPLATMNGAASHYQELSLQGTSGNSTYIQGEIIVGALSMGGNGAITMNLNSNSYLTIRQVAMVN
jgi:hypothetical protein